MSFVRLIVSGVSRRWPLLLVAAVVAAITAGVLSAFDDGATAGDVVGAAVVAGAIGLVVGVVAAWVVEAADPTIRSERELSKATGAPTLAIVPRQPLGAVRPDGVAILRDPNSVESEGYRALRTAVEFVAEQDAVGAGHRATVLLVTSPKPGEGKSSVAVNLAAAASKAGRKVVLIDGDLRRPQLHRLCGLDNAAGLSSVLDGSTKLADAVQRLDGDSKLVVLSAGPPPPEPAELLAHDRLARILGVMADEADLVVIDSPPVLAVTDPAIIGQHSDAALLVATAEVSDRREHAESVRRLGVVGCQVIGTALLQPDDRVSAVAAYRYAPSAAPANWWVSAASRSGGAAQGTDGSAGDDAPRPLESDPEWVGLHTDLHDADEEPPESARPSTADVLAWANGEDLVPGRSALDDRAADRGGSDAGAGAADDAGGGDPVDGDDGSAFSGPVDDQR